jgi:cytoskeletal protein RodZ
MLWMIIAVVAVVFGLAVTAGITFFFYRGSSPQKAKIMQPSVPAAQTAVTAQAATSHGVTPSAAGQAAPSAAQTQTVAAVQKPATVPAQAHSGGTGSPPVKPAITKQKKSPAGAPPPAKWPILKLMGILRGTGNAESSAILNGKIINVGQAIADVTVVEIQVEGVILKYGSEKRFLRVGATSY